MEKKRVLLVLLVLLLFFFFLAGCGSSVGSPTPTPTKTPLPVRVNPISTSTPRPPQLIVENMGYDEQKGTATVRIEFGPFEEIKELVLGQEVIIEAWYKDEIMRVHLWLDGAGVLRYRREENQKWHPAGMFQAQRDAFERSVLLYI